MKTVVAVETKRVREGERKGSHAHVCTLACGHTKTVTSTWAPSSVPPVRLKCLVCEK